MDDEEQIEQRAAAREFQSSADPFVSPELTDELHKLGHLGADMEVSERVQRVLYGSASYDDLAEDEQAVVHTVWEARVDQARSNLNLAAEFVMNGEKSWSGALPDGTLVIQRLQADGSYAAQIQQPDKSWRMAMAGTSISATQAAYWRDGEKRRAIEEALRQPIDTLHERSPRRQRTAELDKFGRNVASADGEYRTEAEAWSAIESDADE